MNEMSENARHITHLKTALHVVVILEWLCNRWGCLQYNGQPVLNECATNYQAYPGPIPHTSLVRNAVSRVHSM